MIDREWWLPFPSFCKVARDRVALLKSQGVTVTFKGALQIYRQARDGVFWV